MQKEITYTNRLLIVPIPFLSKIVLRFCTYYMTNELGSNINENRISKAKGSFVLLNGHKTIRKKILWFTLQKKDQGGDLLSPKGIPHSI